MEHPQKRRRYQKDSAPADDIVTLIHLVRQNPALYNYKLEPNQRRRIDILNGWANIAAQVGNKYTVEECRRKWKNLRDTYHQYRLRKSKIGDGLSKWRYAKDMEFLSNVYQPKLKSHRTQNYNNNSQDNLLQTVSESNDGTEHVVTQDMVHSSIISVNDADTFILTAYEDVTHDNDVANDDANIVAHNDLNHDHDSMESCVEIVKHEQNNSLDDEGPHGGDVDYEEVCMYEEAGNTPTVDCETIIGTPATNSTTADEGKFQYIDTNDFCIGAITATSRSQYTNSNTNILGQPTTIKLKNLPLVTSSSTSTSTLDSTTPCVSLPSSMHMQSMPELSNTQNSSINISASNTVPTSSTTAKLDVDSPMLNQGSVVTFPSAANCANLSSALSSALCVHMRDECDLFFDFLKKKIQRFPPNEITSIQVEFLNCVLRREADHAQKIAQNLNLCNNSNNNSANDNNINNSNALN